MFSKGFFFQTRVVLETPFQDYRPFKIAN